MDAKYKFLNGLKQGESADISQGLQECTDLAFPKTGLVTSVKENDTPQVYGAQVHSLGLEGLVTLDPLLAGVGTSLYYGPTALKTDFSGARFEFSSLLGRMYFINNSDGLWFYDGTAPLYKAGAPEVSGTVTAVTDGSGTGGLTGTYNIKVTFVNANGFEGNPSAATSVVVGAGDGIDLTNIPVNSDTNYNISSRRVWIQGGTTPLYANYVLAETISDNTTTTRNTVVTEIDPSTLLETDNDVPPPAEWVFEHYGVFFFGRLATDLNLLQYSKTNRVEQSPVTNAIRVSRSGDPMMWGTKWNGAAFIITRKRAFQVIGSPGQGVLSTNFYLKETASEKGTIAGRSVVPTPRGMFWFAEDGIRVFNGDTSEIFSHDVDDEIAARNPSDAAEALTTGTYIDNKLIMSFAVGSSSVPNRTVVYDFTTDKWSAHDGGYQVFAPDRKNNYLNCGTDQGIARFQLGLQYLPWSLKKQFVTDIDKYTSWQKFQVDMDGSCTAEVYIDGTLQQSYSIATAGRQAIVNRMPSTMGVRADVRLLTSAKKSTQDTVYDITVKGEPARESI